MNVFVKAVVIFAATVLLAACNGKDGSSTVIVNGECIEGCSHGPLVESPDNQTWPNTDRPNDQEEYCDNTQLPSDYGTGYFAETNPHENMAVVRIQTKIKAPCETVREGFVRISAESGSFNYEPNKANGSQVLATDGEMCLTFAIEGEAPVVHTELWIWESNVRGNQLVRYDVNQNRFCLEGGIATLKLQTPDGAQTAVQFELVS